MATVLIEDEGAVRTLTMNRSERRNALTPEMQEELIAAFEAAGAEPGVRVVVLTGAGQAFCAGLDLSALEGMMGRPAEALDEDAARIARMFRAVHTCPVPTIAAREWARGGGWDGAGDAVRFHAGSAGGEVCVYGGEDRVCAGAGFRLTWCCRWGKNGHVTCC